MLGLSLLTGGASAVSSLFGGGGARAPRMNNEQKDLLRSQAELNRAMAERISGGSNQCNQAQQGCFGRRCQQGQQCGRIGNQGMNGAGNGFGPGPMQQMMGGFGQMMDMMSGFGGGGFGGNNCGFPGFNNFGGGFPGGAMGNQQGINFNFF